MRALDHVLHRLLEGARRCRAARIPAGSRSRCRRRGSAWSRRRRCRSDRRCAPRSTAAPCTMCAPHHHRVDAVMRHGAVRADALHHDLEDVEGGHHRAGAHGEAGRPAMPGSCACRRRPRPGTCSNSPSSTMTRPPPSFSSAGWKMKWTVPSKFARLGEVLRRAQQHRRVPVMAAGMHLAGDRRGVGELVGLVHVERVHVGAQADRAPGLARPQRADHAGLGQAAMHLDAERLRASRRRSRRCAASSKAVSGWLWMSWRHAVMSSWKSAMRLMTGIRDFSTKCGADVRMRGDGSSVASMRRCNQASCRKFLEGAGSAIAWLMQPCVVSGAAAHLRAGLPGVRRPGSREVVVAGAAGHTIVMRRRDLC